MQGGQQFVGQRIHRRQVHRSRKDVVARLALVHVVVGVHQAAFPTRATEQFTRPVGQYLVDVHVGLGARAGLPDHQRKLLFMRASHHFIASRHDGRGAGGIQQTQAVVHIRAGTLDLGQRPDEFRGHAFARDGKVLQRALGLRPPQAPRRHVDGAKSVALRAVGRCFAVVQCHVRDPGLRVKDGTQHNQSLPWRTSPWLKAGMQATR